jgi:hypothetical protein
MWEAIVKLGIFLALLLSLEKLFAKLIKPRLFRTKMEIFVQMVTDWFDYIDRNLERGLNLAEINNREEKIHEFIREKLVGYRIKPSKKIINKWNRRMGLKEDYWNSVEIFQKYSRISANGISIEMFFNMLVGNFMKFYAQYRHKQAQATNFADVRMSIQFLKFCLKERGLGR